ncbi:hypothetical protein [Thermopirellula anaerolimosa]
MTLSLLAAITELLGLGVGLYLHIAKVHGLFAVTCLAAIYRRLSKLRVMSSVMGKA